MIDGLQVEDEKEIVVGDIATVTVHLTRKNLQEGEAAGPVHAPLFPEPKFEEWWIFLVGARSDLESDEIYDLYIYICIPYLEVEAY